MNNIYPPATQRPGPIDKQGYGSVVVNACRGVVCHSMVGYKAGALIELDKASRRASWHFSVLQSGEVLQHYPVNAVTWHCGSAQWNEKLIGIEHEGGFDPVDEPLTDAQREASVALVRWLSQECGFPLERKVALWEHNEVAPPSDATSCPSNRIPWDAYTEEHMPTAEYESLKETQDAIKATLAGNAIDTNKRLEALQASTDFLIKVVNDLAPRVKALEAK